MEDIPQNAAATEDLINFIAKVNILNAAATEDLINFIAKVNILFILLFLL